MSETQTQLEKISQSIIDHYYPSLKNGYATASSTHTIYENTSKYNNNTTTNSTVADTNFVLLQILDELKKMNMEIKNINKKVLDEKNEDDVILV
jgi:hypothetical protein